MCVQKTEEAFSFFPTSGHLRFAQPDGHPGSFTVDPPTSPSMSNSEESERNIPYFFPDEHPIRFTLGVFPHAGGVSRVESSLSCFLVCFCHVLLISPAPYLTHRHRAREYTPRLPCARAFVNSLANILGTAGQRIGQRFRMLFHRISSMFPRMCQR